MLFFLPYLGSGYVYANEKEDVKGYTGHGKIWGYHFFFGLRMLNSHFLSDRLGVNIEFGKSVWNYDNSILYENNSAEKYNYPNFYFCLGLTFLIIK